MCQKTCCMALARHENSRSLGSSYQALQRDPGFLMQVGMFLFCSTSLFQRNISTGTCMSELNPAADARQTLRKLVVNSIQMKATKREAWRKRKRSFGPKNKLRSTNCRESKQICCACAFTCYELARSHCCARHGTSDRHAQAAQECSRALKAAVGKNSG